MPTVGRYYSPLRYPGGKQRLAPLIERLVDHADLADGEYAEPYAGGAAIGLTLLIREYVRTIHINDMSRPIYCFWRSLLDTPDELCRLISSTRLSVSQWKKQRAVVRDSINHSTLELGFAAFYLNRTSRSGIIVNGGVIGGLKQDGPWTLAARFNKRELIGRVSRIAMYRDRIQLSCMDAKDFLPKIVRNMPERSLAFLDPPYYRGAERLYEHWYSDEDHASIAKAVLGLPTPWVVTYDACSRIQHLYSRSMQWRYSIQYSAARRYSGSELLIISPHLEDPLEKCKDAGSIVLHRRRTSKQQRRRR